MTSNDTNAPPPSDPQPESFDRHTQPIEPSVPSEMRPQAPPSEKPKRESDAGEAAR